MGQLSMRKAVYGLLFGVVMAWRALVLLEKLEGILELPVSQPTCVAFGGPNMDILFVTSATEGLTPEQKASEPLAGSVLIYQTGARGLPEPKVNYYD